MEFLFELTNNNEPNRLVIVSEFKLKTPVQTVLYGNS